MDFALRRFLNGMSKCVEKNKGSFLKRISLKGRLSIVLGAVSFVLILVLCYILVHSFELDIDPQIDDSMTEKAMNGAAELSSTVDKLSHISATINEGISFIYDENDKVGEAPVQTWKVQDFSKNNMVSVTGMEPVTLRSGIVDKEIPASRYNAEAVLLNTLHASILEDENIIGGGTFFEPNTFFPDSSDYGIFITREGAKEKIVQRIDYDLYKDKEYYKAGKEGKSVITNVYKDDKAGGAELFTITSPIMVNGEFKGLTLLDINADVLTKVSKTDAEYPTMFSEIIDSEEVIHGNEKQKGMKLSDVLSEKAYKEVKDLMAGGERFTRKVIGKSGAAEREFFEPVNLNGTTWWFRINMTEIDYDHAVDRMVLVATGLGLLTVAIVILATVFYLNKSLKPLAMVSRCGKKLAEGDFDIEMSYAYQDEIGALILAIQEVVDRVRHIISDLTEKLGEMAKGNFNLSKDNEEYYTGAYIPILEALSKITTDLSQTMSEIQGSAMKVNSSAGQVSFAAQGLSEGATEQASSIGQLSSTMSDISERIKETAHTAQEASRLSTDTGNAVVMSNTKMEEMSRAMVEITEKSNEISKIIKTIDDIAFQTNILSLNAAIEAARAGAAGKGFAVVADEVGNLAQKSAKAAQNTASLIEETIDAVEKGARISRETAESLDTVSQHTEKINNYIQDISAASEEEARGIAQLTQGIDQISSVVQNNSATAQESAAASEEMSGQANILNDLVERFTLKEN